MLNTKRGSNDLELTDKEQKEYSILRAIRCLISGAETDKRENTFECEISDEIAKRWEGKRHGGLFIPYKIGIDHSLAANAARRLQGLGTRAASTLTSQTAGQGKELVFTEPGSFLEFLYNQMRLKQLGARTLSGLSGNIGFPKQTGKSAGAWVSENPGNDVADSNLTLSQVPMAPHTYQSSASYSRQLLAQSPSSNVDVDMLVRMDLARDCALAIDNAGFNGAGGDSPTGILNATGVQSYTLENDTGNGAKPVWDDIVGMQELLEAVNADQLGTPAWATTPGIKSVLKRTARLGNTIGLPIWDDDNTVDGLDAAWTNQLPSNGTEGSGSNLSPLVLGAFFWVMVGMWGSGFELIVDPYRLKKQGIVELTSFQMVDIGVLYPAAFVVAPNCAKQ